MGRYFSEEYRVQETQNRIWVIFGYRPKTFFLDFQDYLSLDTEAQVIGLRPQQFNVFTGKVTTIISLDCNEDSMRQGA